MYVSIGINRKNKGAHEFFRALPELIKDASTWRLESKQALSAVVQHTGRDTALPDSPRFEIRENSAGSVSAHQLDAGTWTHEERVLALNHLLYLFQTALSSYTSSIRIET